jgi:hypothetical protein
LWKAPARDSGHTIRCVRADGPCAPTDVNRTFGCGKTVADLEAVAKAPDDPTRIFHKQQTCIARKSCDLRCRMDNCKWMEWVIPDFTVPYLAKAGEWAAREADCQALKQTLSGVPGGSWIADRECFRSMGWYHVRVDLQSSLNKFGCGSDSDWALVGEQIKGCLLETNPNDPAWVQAFGDNFIRFVRTTVSLQCKAARLLQSKPQDINDDLRGKVCDMQ